MSEASGSKLLSASQRRFLRYWALNVTLTYRAGWPWIPGFGYTGDEKRRLAELAAPADVVRTAVWLTSVVIIALLALILTALVGGFVLLTIFTMIWPNASAIPIAAIAAGFAVIAGVVLSIEMPFAMGFGGVIADWLMGASDVAPDAGDVQLHAKVRWQFLRLPLVVVPLAVVAFFGWALVLGR